MAAQRVDRPGAAKFRPCRRASKSERDSGCVSEGECAMRKTPAPVDPKTVMSFSDAMRARGRGVEVQSRKG